MKSLPAPAVFLVGFGFGGMAASFLLGLYVSSRPSVEQPVASQPAETFTASALIPSDGKFYMKVNCADVNNDGVVNMGDALFVKSCVDEYSKTKVVSDRCKGTWKESPSVSVEGKVVDQDGNPVVGATVVAE